MRQRSRRTLLILSAFGPALLPQGSVGTPLSDSVAEASPRPNFVVVVTDDQRWDTIGRCTNGFDPHDLSAGEDSCMPNLQQHLAANGMTFRRAYATTSLCCPSRVNILTGRYSRHTGVVDNFGFPSFDDESNLATWLDDAGYRTALIGKYLNGYGESCCSTPANYVPPGWDTWHSFWGTPGYTGYSMVHMDEGAAPITTSYSGTASAPIACAPETVYSTDQLCRRALDFVAADASDPFFLFFNPFSPHAPETPPSRWSNIYTATNQPVELPRYPNYNEVPFPNPPSWLSRKPLGDTTLKGIDAGFRRSLRTNRAADDSIDALFHQLVTDGRVDDTVFVFLSDNGLSRAEHRHDTKACEYEECHRIPLVVVCPLSVCPGSMPGAVDSDHFALTIDIAPTIADLAGVRPPGSVDGTSLVPLLDNEAADWRTSFLIEETGMTGRNKPLGIVGVADDGHLYKYVKFLRAASELEMYDLTDDPWELANLANDGSHAAVQSWLAAALDQAFYPPVVAITDGPSGAIAQSDVTFEWVSDEPAAFECALNSEPFADCGAGTNGSVTFHGLALSDHAFVLRSTDQDNNVAEPIGREFTVTADTTPPPVPVFTETPPDPSGQDVSFSFTDDEPDVLFTCSLDDEPVRPCSSPDLFTGLSHGSHHFEVFASDDAGNHSGVASYVWSVIDSTAPGVPTITRTPADPSGPETSFSFAGDEPHLEFRCSLDGSAYHGCASPQSYAALADGDHLFSVTASDAGGNTSPPASYEWTADNTPAAPFLTATPGDPGGPSASFSFAVPSEVTPECSLDGGGFEECSSPHAYTGLSDGLHTFRVRSSDGAGETSGAASYTWVVDSVPPPAPSFTATPGDPDGGDASFSFQDEEENVEFYCSLDDGSSDSCSSPRRYTGLEEGLHTFRVVAADEAGNNSAAASFTWTVDTTSPAPPQLTRVPPDPGPAEASFSFAGEEDVGFVCSLDGDAFAPCTSPRDYNGLLGGTHAFRVSASDAAGNLSGAATYEWTVDAVIPTVQMNGRDDTFVITRSVRASWSGTDDAGIVRYEVYEREGTDGVQRLVASDLNTAYTTIGSPGTTYCYQVLAFDAAGNAGRSVERCQAVPADDRDPSVTYSGAVNPISTSSSWENTLTILDGVGRQMQYTFNGRKFGILARRTPYSGQADVYVDGVFAARVDFYASTERERVYVYQAGVDNGSHTLDVLWTGEMNQSSGGTALHLDGVATIDQN